MAGWLKKIFGTQQSRIVKKYVKIVKQVNAIEQELQKLSDEELTAKTTEFKKRLQDGEDVNALLPEAYAVVKNCCRRLCGSQIHIFGYDQLWDMIPYDVQIVGAIALHNNSIAEMQTGEGKTLTAAMPLYLHALSGKPVHLVTVNDYLAERDCAWIGTIFRKLGLEVKALTNQTPIHERKDTYLADIVYGTASEFGFDYLRDNSMAQSKLEQCQRGHYFAIVDEVDSILIDEARTPLIISGPSPESNQMYGDLRRPVYQIVKLQRDFCNHLASDAKKTLDKLNAFADEKPSLSKEDTSLYQSALEDLWLVSKGTPRNKILKRVKEHPDLRAELEQVETFFYAESNKERRFEELSKLYMVVDERSSDYELTDKGIQAWAGARKENNEEDFTMLDLGHEYAQIDQDPNLSDEEKLQKKVTIREQDSLRKERIHNVRQLFRAHLLMEKDVDYIIDDRKVVIIDENTGRPQPGRRFSDGLHQAIEAKESVDIQQETQTYATITLQNYFRLYTQLGGMSGTAITEANEFKQIYNLDVVIIPTHKSCVRADADDQIYMTEREKYQAILQEILSVHEKGRPILIGTESVEVSEKLSRILKQNRLPHIVLNAKNHAKEAEIIAKAGQKGAITVSTNMAGRGTDIKLGEHVAENGGLHVIGTTRHQSRRIDRQLRGRSARQGDPGSSKFFVSFEDSLMRLFTSPKLSMFLQKFRPPEGEPIAAPILNRSIETAQKRVEQRNFAIRKHTLEYDDVMNQHRAEVYAFRNDILNNEHPIKLATGLLEDLVANISSRFQQGFVVESYIDEITQHFPVTLEQGELENKKRLEDIEAIVIEKVIEAFQVKLEHQAQIIAALQESAGKEKDPLIVINDIIRSIVLKCIDKHWQEHLLNIDHLRTEVSMRVVGQKDPLVEFKHEAFALFDRFSSLLKQEAVHGLFKFQMMLPPSEEISASISRILKSKKQKSYITSDLVV